jgi:hypothetical protein
VGHSTGCPSGRKGNSHRRRVALDPMRGAAADRRWHRQPDRRRIDASRLSGLRAPRDRAVPPLYLYGLERRAVQDTDGPVGRERPVIRADALVAIGAWADSAGIAGSPSRLKRLSCLAERL